MEGGLHFQPIGSSGGPFTVIIKVNAHGHFEECAVLKNASCAFGVFDGVHLGHRFIIGKASSEARRREESCVIITFAEDPDETFRPDSLKKLMSNQHRLRVLDSLGANYVLVLPATKGFFALSPKEFMDRVFGNNAPASLHVGKDFRFGAHAQGRVSALKEWGAPHDMSVCGYDLLQLEGAPVTATRIRSLLASCDIAQANRLLGSRFALEGIVETGRGQGRNMGFRTANVTIPASHYSLGEGVYGAYAVTEASRRFKAAVSVGGAPTFGSAAHANIEAHILDFDQDIYGQNLRLEFAAFLRPMIVFSSTEELIETVMGNIQWCRDNL